MSSQYKVKRVNDCIVSALFIASVKRVNDCIVSALFIASYALTMITTQHKR